MTLIKYQKPENGILRRNDDFLTFADIIDSFFGNSGLDRIDSKVSMPPVNIAENKDSFQIEMAIPGVKKDQVEINLEKNVLTIKSKNEKTENEESANYTRKQFSYELFERSFTLPQTADTEKISASHNDGVLTITINKKEEAKEKPARIINIS